MTLEYGIEEIEAAEGMDRLEIAEQFIYEANCPNICSVCGNIEYWEHDVVEADCNECDALDSINSLFVLMGIM